MEDPQKKYNRLLLLHRLFNEHRPGFKVSELSQRLGVKERTIQRDLIELQVFPFNLPLYKEGWVWLLASDKAIPLPPIILNREQAAALFIGARLLSQHSGRLSPIAVSAIQKLAQALPAEIGAFLQKDNISDDLPYTAEQISSQQIFASLVTAWIERRKTRCIHQTLRGITHTYHLAPYTFEPSAVGHAIYVRGRCDEDPARQLRTLKLERIRQVTLTEEHFQLPSDTTEFRFENAWRIWESDEAQKIVHLKFTPKVTERVKETIWHPSQKLTELPDGSCEWEAQIAEPTEMLPWIRGWGAECEVLAPAEIRNALIREARKLAELYKITPQKAIAPEPVKNELASETRLQQTFKDFFGE